MPSEQENTVIDLAAAVPSKIARVLVLDDHPVVREGLACCLANQSDMELCGEASDAAEALELIHSLCPDIVIVDVSLKIGNGIDFVKQIKEISPSTRTLVWSMHSDSLYAERAIRAGADGYLNKEHATDNVIDAIRQILTGRVFLSHTTADQLLRRTLGMPANPHASVHGTSPVEKLSDRELETFQLIGQGLNTIDVAQKMNANRKTIETYLARIKKKFNFDGRQQLVHAAAQWVMETH